MAVGAALLSLGTDDEVIVMTTGRASVSAVAADAAANNMVTSLEVTLAGEIIACSVNVIAV